MRVGWLKTSVPHRERVAALPSPTVHAATQPKMIQSGVHERSPTPTGDLRWLRQRFAINLLLTNVKLSNAWKREDLSSNSGWKLIVEI
jgi:hypothetical protein